MRRLIESTFVSLGGDIAAPQEWGLPYLNCPDGDAGADVGFHCPHMPKPQRLTG
jgi:hypothetical protein